MITLCTLFDSNYLDKGFTMYESINRITHDFIMYVLCMDERCYEIISDMALQRFIPVHLSEYETPELLRVKKERSVGEYCWTNSSYFTYYIMEKFQPEYCAYIDSDLYFYDNPNVVIDEMSQRNASVMIVGHRFHSFDKKYMINKVGRYCVEFNTFKNDKNGKYLLNKWREQCLEYCKCDGDGKHWADQKYMDNWCNDYTFVVETQNFGAGVAPWNIAQYKLVNSDEYGPTAVICKGKSYRMFFYHFQNVRYLDASSVLTNTENTWGIQKNMIETTYVPYLRHIRRTKEMLKRKYSIDNLIKVHPGYSEQKKSVWQKIQFLTYLLFTQDGQIRLWNQEIPFLLYRKYEQLSF